ncbi:MAG: rhombosortase [Burkholderiaceae bacterium]|nr:rhombosortase [Burkholderiaceae bacterium]
MNSRARWPFVLALALLSLAASLAPGALEALRWERAAIADGQWGRLLSAHFAHIDTRHLMFNLLGLVLVAEWLLERWRLAALWSLLLASALGTGLLLWLFEPGLRWYAGLSGALHGLWAGAALAGWWRWRRPLFAGALAALAIKLAFFNDGPGGMPVVAAAHVYGAASGMVWALLRRPTRTLPDHFD